MRVIFVLLLFVIMLVQSLYSEIFFNCLRFQTKDSLSTKDCYFKFEFLVLRIMMAIVSFSLKGQGTAGIIRDLLLFLILVILVTRHYFDFPFRNKFT